MKNTSFLFLMICFMLCGEVWAQTIKIVQQQGLSPLAGAIVKVGERSFSSDANGQVTIQSIASDVKISISMIGFRSVETNIKNIKKNNNVVYLNEQSYNKEEVVISANRLGQSSKQSAQQIKVISAKEIARTNVQTTADLLQNSGMVNVQKSQAGGGSPIIRGFEANKVLMVVDGVRMNNAIYRGGHLQNIITVDQSMLERTEILFGPGSLMYGSDALGGVMNFVTKDPTLSNSTDLNIGGNAYTRYSSANNERTGSVGLHLANQRFGLIGNFTYSDFDDLKSGKNIPSSMDSLGVRNFYQGRINGVDTMLRNDDIYLQRESGYTQYDVMAKLLFKQNERVSHVLNFQYSTSSDIPRYDRLSEINSTTGKFNNAQWYYGPQKRLFLSYQLRLKNAAWYDDAIITAGFQDIEESRHNRTWGRPNLGHRTEQVKVYSLNADFNKEVLFGSSLRYGMEATYNDVQSEAYRENVNTGSISPLDTRYPDGGSNTQSIAAYGTLMQNVGSKFIFTEGIRMSLSALESVFEDTTFFSFPFNSIEQKNSMATFQLGAIYLPDETWKISMNLSSGFRTPNVDDLAKVFDSNKGDTAGNNSNLGTLIVPNAELKPEKTYNADLSISKSINSKLHITANVYYTLLRDAIVTTNSTFNGQPLIVYGDTLAQVQQNVNAGKAYIWGSSLQMLYDLNTQFTIMGSINYTQGVITSGPNNTPLDHIAPTFGRVGLTYQYKKFNADAYTLFNATKKLDEYNLTGEDNLNYATKDGMPAWYTLNVRASYRINSYFLFQAGMENILDRSYRVFASGINAAGRNVSLSLRASF